MNRNLIMERLYKDYQGLEKKLQDNEQERTNYLQKVREESGNFLSIEKIPRGYKKGFNTLLDQYSILVASKMRLIEEICILLNDNIYPLGNNRFLVGWCDSEYGYMIEERDVLPPDA